MRSLSGHSSSHGRSTGTTATRTTTGTSSSGSILVQQGSRLGMGNTSSFLGGGAGNGGGVGRGGGRAMAAARDIRPGVVVGDWTDVGGGDKEIDGEDGSNS